jgi:hypothetical protein
VNKQATCLLPASCWLLNSSTLTTEAMFTPKRLSFSELHGVTTHRTVLFVVTVGKTSYVSLVSQVNRKLIRELLYTEEQALPERPLLPPQCSCMTALVCSPPTSAPHEVPPHPALHWPHSFPRQLFLEHGH